MTLLLARLLRRFGLARTTVLVTIASVIVSELVTLLLTAPRGTWPDTMALVVAAIVPSLCAPLFTWFQLRLVLELQQARDELRRLSITDELSQAYNRRHFIEVAEGELARALRYDSTFSIVIVDLDGFKALNDRHGHLAGDQMLQAVSAACRAEVRAIDLFARLGGEEFVLLLPSTDATGAAEIAERLRERIAAAEVVLSPGTVLRTTASFGIARHDQSMTRLGQLLAMADHALYAAKRAGKNRVAIATIFADGPQAIVVSPEVGRTAGGSPRFSGSLRPSGSHRADDFPAPAA